MNIDEQKRQAFSLYSRGKSKRDIAAALDVTTTKVTKWIQDQRQIVNLTLEKINKEDYVGVAMQRFAELRDEVWTGLEGCSKVGDKIKYIKTAMSLEEKEASFLMEMGFLSADTKNEELNVNVVGHLKHEVNMAALDGLAAAMLSKRMGITPEQFLAMQGSHRNVFQLAESVGLEEKTNGIHASNPEPMPVVIDVLEEPENGKHHEPLDDDEPEGEK